MDNKDFENKENLGHGIKGDVSTADNKLKSKTNNVKNRANDLRSDKNRDNN